MFMYIYIYMYIYIFFFCCFFWMIFFIFIDCSLLKRWAVSQIAIFSVSYQLELPDNLFVPFLIIPSAPVVILRCHIYAISIFRSFYLLISLCIYLIDMLLSVGTTILIRRHVFLLQSLITTSGLQLFIFLSVGFAMFRSPLCFCYWF